MRKEFVFFAALALGGCVTTPEPVVTRADREAIYEAFNDSSACETRILASFPEYDKANLPRDCGCIRRQFADLMPARLAAPLSRSVRTGEPIPLPERESMAIMVALVPRAYAACGVEYIR